MTKETILDEVRKLTPEDREEVLVAIGLMDTPGNELSEEQISELKKRYAEYLQNPTEGRSWEEIRSELGRQNS